MYFFAGSFHRMQNVKDQMMAKITLTPDTTLTSQEKVSTYDHLTFSILQSGYCKINLPYENNSEPDFKIIITCLYFLFLISLKSDF